MRHASMTLTLLLLAAMGGCATDFPRVDASFGKALAQTIAAQTYDPAASAHPAALAPEASDGQRIANVLAAHRKDVPQQASQQVAQTPQFQAGQQ
jgi:type IV pilus biogenesis protein CpaD/CtpE